MTDDRDRSRRRTDLLLLVAGTLLAGVILGVVGAGAASRTITGHDVSPGPILVSADGMTLAGSLGGCGGGYLEVSETGADVTVVLHRTPSFMVAPGECGIETFATRLRTPLGSRRLVDGVTHATLPSFDGTQMLHPTYLPDGFVHRYDTATLPDEETDRSGPGCVQVYTQADSWDEAIWVTQQVGAVWVQPAGVPAVPVTVRGRPGQAIPGEVEWTENGELIRVQSHSYAYATPGTDELVRIADSLR